jgi:aarF domain-containing kinase
MSGELMNTLQFGIKGTLRIAQTLRTLTSTGLDWILGERPPGPALIRQTFEKLGATYIKLGQFIASSPSLFPPEYIQEFQSCLDRTESLPFATLEQVLKKELGRSLKTLFADIDPQPLASASIAQVHAARLTHGEDVVIKVQKPGVQDILQTDLHFLYLSAKILEFLKPDISWASLSGIVSEIQRTIMEECDFLKEADHLTNFREFLERTGNDQVMAPRVYPRATTGRVLTMERLYGVPLTDLTSIRQYNDDPENTLITAMNTWFSSLLLCEFFHADLHAGNLLVLQDGRIGFIDFGIVGKISPATWTAMTSLIGGLEQGDYRTIAKALAAIGITKKSVEIDRLAQDLERLFGDGEEFSRQPPHSKPYDQEINRFLLDMVALGNRHGLHFPREFTLLVKQFLYFDRYVQMMAPDLDIYGDSRVELNPRVAFSM